MADKPNGILEPKGLAPAVGKTTVDMKVGVARDALAVAIQVGDILVHISPQAAEETATGLMMAARTIRDLQARRDGKILGA